MAITLETVLLSLRKVLVIEDHRGPTYKCPSSDLRPRNFRGHAFCRHSAPESRWMKKTRNFSYESARRRNLLICTNCLRKSCIPDTSASVERVFTQVDYPCSHTVGQLVNWWW